MDLVIFFVRAVTSQRKLCGFEGVVDVAEGTAQAFKVRAAAAGGKPRHNIYGHPTSSRFHRDAASMECP